MKKRMMAVAALVATSSLLLAGCAASGGEGESTEPIVIGTTLSLTGPLQAFGTNLEIGYETAIEEINAAGGIEVDGVQRPIELIVQDNASDGDKAAEQARSLVLDDGAVALLGAATPPITIPVSAAAEQLKVPVISSITPIRAFLGGNPDGYKYAWDVFFDEVQMTQTQFQAADTITTNKKVALFTDQEEDGIVMGGIWETVAPEAGYEIVYRGEFPVGNANFASQVSAAMAANAEVVIAQVIPPDGIALLKEMKAQGYDPQIMFMEKAGNTGGFPTITEGLANGVMAANWYAAGMGLDREQEFIDKFSAQLGGVNSDLGTLVCGYSIAQVLFDAIKAAGSTDPAAINDAIGKTDGTFPAGKIKFSADHVASLPAVQTQWVGNDMILVTDADGKSVNPVIAPMPGLAK
ncbi:branched-chain amino acid transport system substrate-binding protein [Aurantimicrobium minutum]|uniref:ABC transporter substrate-binding protein n=1 Tax=Aurantimicrobium minutum TaxID=708131 RepID=UPI00247414BF|nr:ABC transporter substrate-binding protein [Aurantimicrobium minutum]MDH6424281.1 branched-chain amino acid transport system substrate-binding protein [Aurantimicrobium minutum]